MSSPTHKRWWPRFSLLTLTLFVAACGTGYGTWARWAPWAVVREYKLPLLSSSAKRSGEDTGSFEYTVLEGSAKVNLLRWSPDSGRLAIVATLPDVQLRVKGMVGTDIESKEADLTELVMVFPRERLTVLRIPGGETLVETTAEFARSSRIRFDVDGRLLHLIPATARSLGHKFDPLKLFIDLSNREIHPVDIVPPPKRDPPPLDDASQDRDGRTYAPDGIHCAAPSPYGDSVFVYAYQYPEEWYGVFWLRQFWLTTALLLAMGFSLRRDWKTLRGA